MHHDARSTATCLGQCPPGGAARAEAVRKTPRNLPIDTRAAENSISRELAANVVTRMRVGRHP